MSTHFDEKGKIFTPVITKKPVEVIIQTVMHRITGNIHVHLDERLIDELDRGEPFLAITDAKIFDLNGLEVHTAAFVSVSRQQIIWVLPVDELLKSNT